MAALWLGLAPAWAQPPETAASPAPASSQEFKKTPAKARASNFETIFDYKEQLTLTPEQADKIKQALVGLAQRTNELRARKQLAVRASVDLLKKDAPLDEIRKSLEAIAALDVQARFDDIATAREVLKLLSDQQRQKWVKIQTSARNVLKVPEPK